MKKIALYCNQDHIKYKDSVMIAEKLQIKIINTINLANLTTDYDYILVWCNQIVGPDCSNANRYCLAIIDNLSFNENNKQYLYVDYINNLIANKKCYQFNYQDALVKAMGLHKLKDHAAAINILDGTAGFTLDAYALMQLNDKINLTLLESSPIIYSLVNDGFSRFKLSNNKEHQAFSTRWQLYHSNFIDYLTGNTVAGETKFDIIYLDPMFEKQQKNGVLYVKSKPKKNMQLLQDLCFNPNTVEELLMVALKFATNRVVLKRNIKQEKLFEKQINYSVASKQIRYDVYLTKNIITEHRC